MTAANNFMWGYQGHFLTSATVAAETLFSKLDPMLEPHVFLVGVLIEEHPRRSPVCIEPDDCGYDAARFTSVKTRAAELVKEDPEGKIFHSHPIAQKNNWEQIRRRALMNAVEEQIRADDAANGVTSFCSVPILLEGYQVIIVLQLDRAALESHYSLTKKIRDRMHFNVSLIDATINEYLTQCAKGLTKPNPGAGLNVVDREADELIRSAGKALMYAPANSGNNFHGLHGFFEACNAISSLKYEGVEGLGRIVVSRKDHPNVHIEMALTVPVPIRDYRAVRKLLEISSGGLSLLTDSAEIYGLGGMKDTYDATTEELFTIEFRQHHDWELCHDNRRLMRVVYGQPRLPKGGIDKALFENTLDRIFNGISAEGKTQLWTAVREAAKQKHGTMVVISKGAATEAVRLINQSTLIKSRILSVDLVRKVTAIDGALLLDPIGVCHAIGVILDGLASKNGDPSRGARYNSAIRYVESSPSPCMAVVVSADATINFVPDLMPQIPRSELEAAINRLRELKQDAKFSLKNFYRTLDWLQKHRFYLTAAVCEEVNRLRREGEATRDRVVNPNIKPVYSDFEPNEDMNDSYFL